MKKIAWILLLLFFSVNVYAVNLGLFYNDGFGGVSATNDSTFFGIGYTNVDDSTNLETGHYTVDYWSFILLFRDKPIEELKLNYLSGVGYSTITLRTDSNSVHSNQYAVYLGLETRINRVELKLLYIPLLFGNIKFPSEEERKRKTTWNEGLRLLVNVPF